MSTTLVLVFILTFIATVGFILLVLTLVPTIKQFRIFLKDMQKTSTEVRELAAKFRDLSEKLDDNVVKVNSIIDSSKETVDIVTKTVKKMNSGFLKSSAGLFAVIPVLKFGWNLLKKYKGGK